MLKLSSKPIGKGSERACFIHPEDPRKAIKIPYRKVHRQTIRDIKLYHDLEKRGIKDLPNIPAYYGLSDTNAGRGIVVDLVRNYDGELSRTLSWYLEQGVPVEEFDSYLEDLKQMFLKNRILFNEGLDGSKLLVQKSSTSQARLVAIDGLGDTSRMQWFNRFSVVVRRKIERRWKGLIIGLYKSRETTHWRDHTGQRKRN